jgi:hypothetical protein
LRRDAKPWVPRNGKLFTKADFKIHMRARTNTCPAGEIERNDLGADGVRSAEVAIRYIELMAVQTLTLSHSAILVDKFQHWVEYAALFGNGVCGQK